MSVSFDLELGEAIRTAAEEESLSVSAWLAEAARARLKNKLLGEAMDAWKAKYGDITEEELEEARADFALARKMAHEKREREREQGRKKEARRGARP